MRWLLAHDKEIRLWRKFTDHKRPQILAERRRREAKLAERRAIR